MSKHTLEDRQAEADNTAIAHACEEILSALRCLTDCETVEDFEANKKEILFQARLIIGEVEDL